MKKILAFLMSLIIFTGGAAMAEKTTWDKTFKKSDKVDIQKVSFTNRYGITLVGDLYIPKEKPAGKMPAIALSGPFGAVKEQASGLYAQTLAQRGFIHLLLTLPIRVRAAARQEAWLLLTFISRTFPRRLIF